VAALSHDWQVVLARPSLGDESGLLVVARFELQ
jgi:hypothetical protein